MLFGALGCVFAVTFFALEYGKWKRKALAISREGKIIRSISFVFLLGIFGGIFTFGLFVFMNIKKTALTVFLTVLLLILFLLISLFTDFRMTRKNKFYLKNRNSDKVL